MADRIRARAVRRCGELLQEIQGEPGARTDLRPSAGADTRFGAASNAGLSRRQTVTALRVAAVPREQFVELVDRAEIPITITRLAELGTRNVDVRVEAATTVAPFREFVVEREAKALLEQWQKTSHERRMRFLDKLAAVRGRTLSGG